MRLPPKIQDFLKKGQPVSLSVFNDEMPKDMALNKISVHHDAAYDKNDAIVNALLFILSKRNDGQPLEAIHKHLQSIGVIPGPIKQSVQTRLGQALSNAFYANDQKVFRRQGAGRSVRLPGKDGTFGKPKGPRLRDPAPTLHHKQDVFERPVEFILDEYAHRFLLHQRINITPDTVSQLGRTKQNNSKMAVVAYETILNRPNLKWTINSLCEALVVMGFVAYPNLLKPIIKKTTLGHTDVKAFTYEYGKIGVTYHRTDEQLFAQWKEYYTNGKWHTDTYSTQLDEPDNKGSQTLDVLFGKVRRSRSPNKQAHPSKRERIPEPIHESDDSYIPLSVQFSKTEEDNEPVPTSHGSWFDLLESDDDE